MRLSRKLVVPAMFVGAGAIAAGAATIATGMIEDRAESAVAQRLSSDGIGFATVTADGLALRLTGTAPTEAARFRAVNLAGSVVDPSRIRDELEVTPARELEVPDFSIEMLRNDNGVSLIGLVPEAASRPALDAARKSLGDGVQLSDMLESGEYTAPDGWEDALDFGLGAVSLLPRSKISVTPGRVEITAIAAGAEEKARFETSLAALKPDDLETEIAISAPRPVFTPFAMRFVKNEAGARFDACAADSDAARDRILAAATEAGAEGADCTIGLGAPTGEWATAAEAAIRAVNTLGNGSVTIADADITLTGVAGMAQTDFDRAASTLQNALPDVFSLTATLPRAPTEPTEGPAAFTAAVDGEGAARITGRVRDAMAQQAIDSFARAQFGASRVAGTTVIDETMPQGWSIRVMAGLEALGMLEDGELSVTPEAISVSGRTGSKLMQNQIETMLGNKLGANQSLDIAAIYDEDLDPNAALPTPQECLTRLNGLMKAQKIAFAPGSAEIEASARETITGTAEILLDCPHLSFEIQGHTDSQGSEGGNQSLSQARAEAVMLALQGRRIPMDRLTAVGYGEANPIADNSTEDGREANRRIEFKLTDVAPDPNALPAEQAAAAVQQIEESLFPPDEEEMLRIPGDAVDGSGDGDPDATEGDEQVDEEPSFAPTGIDVRPERRPEE